MNQLSLKIQLAWVLLAAVLCFALPVFGEEPDFYVPEIPGADVLQEELTESTSTRYDDQGNVIGEAATEVPLPDPDTDPEPEETTGLPSQTYFDYSGEIDLLTGEPIDKDAVQNENGIYNISPGWVAYDSNNGMYRLYCGDAYLNCSLPGGAVINANSDPLSITEAVGLNFVLYREKEVISQSEVQGITQPGAYTLIISDNRGNSVSYGFLLVDRYTNLTSEVYLPDGFTFVQVEMNHQPQTLEFSNYFQFLLDAEYRMVYHCPAIGRTYEVNFTLDRVAPVLELPQVFQGLADSGVTLTDLEEGAVIYCTHEGFSRKITDKNEVLSLPGKYVLKVTDRAGNTSTYQFRMKVYLDIQAGSALILLAVMGAVTLVYARRLRRSPKVY